MASFGDNLESAKLISDLGDDILKRFSQGKLVIGQITDLPFKHGRLFELDASPFNGFLNPLGFQLNDIGNGQFTLIAFP